MTKGNLQIHFQVNLEIPLSTKHVDSEVGRWPIHIVFKTLKLISKDTQYCYLQVHFQNLGVNLFFTKTKIHHKNTNLVFYTYLKYVDFLCLGLFGSL